MKKPHAHWLTVHKADIDPDTSIEILRETVPNTLKLLLFRIDHGSRSRLVTEEIGPFRCLAELRHQLCVLFGELSAQRICQNLSPWFPPGIPAAPANSSSTVTLGIAADDRGSDLQPQVTRRRRGIAPPSEATRCLTTAPPTSKSSH